MNDKKEFRINNDGQVNGILIYWETTLYKDIKYSTKHIFFYINL